MSWTGSNTPPRRQPGETLRDIQFRHELDNHGGQTDRIIGQFYHRDGRLWQARIAPVPAEYQTERFNFEALILTLSSAGCRNYQFISGNIGSAKRTALRFGNVQPADYERLIADARGSTEYPRPDTIGVFQINVARRVRVYTTVETERYTLRGIGRVENGRIIIFPQEEELEAIFEPVCDEDTVPLIPEGINAIPDQESAFDPTASYNIDLGDPEASAEVVFRNFDDTPEDALRGLESGTYHSGFRRREDRVIDIGDDD